MRAPTTWMIQRWTRRLTASSPWVKLCLAAIVLCLLAGSLCIPIAGRHSWKVRGIFEGVRDNPGHFDGTALPLRTIVIAFSRDTLRLVALVLAWLLLAPLRTWPRQQGAWEAFLLLVFAAPPALLVWFHALTLARYRLVGHGLRPTPSPPLLLISTPAAVALTCAGATALVAILVRLRSVAPTTIADVAGEEPSAPLP